LDWFTALARDRDDADTLVSTGPTVDQTVPLQGGKRTGDACPVHGHVTTKCRNRQLLLGADQAKQRKLRNVQPSVPQELVVHARNGPRRLSQIETRAFRE